jgi:hypothetical protein
MQQQKFEAAHGYSEPNPKALKTTTRALEKTSIDHTTLARLDIGLFRYLSNLGTSKQSVCSALCLTHAEYDYISSHLNTL